MQNASSQGLMSDKLRVPTAPHRQQRQRSLVAEGPFFFLPSWKAPESHSDVPWSLISFNSSNSPIRELS